MPRLVVPASALVTLGLTFLSCTASDGAPSGDAPDGGIGATGGGIASLMTGGAGSAGFPAVAGGASSGGNAGSSNGGAPGGANGSGGFVGAAGSAVGAGGVPAAGGAPAAGGGAGNAGGSPGSTDRCDVGIPMPGTPPSVLSMTGDLGTHDPTVIEEAGVFYELQTGPLLPGKTSTDLVDWRGAPAAFSGANPAWIRTRVPDATDLWAPDLSFFSGQYHLYYSASSFGVNTSCIGHATRSSMASGSFADQGPVLCSGGGDDFNAIDPSLIVDTGGTPWLAFGSFWSGIKIIRLDPSGARADDVVYSIASRGRGAIEAPFVVRRCGYYYLFVSFDRCCAAERSTYNLRVGRSADLLGPYVDKNGTSMMNGGGTVVVSGGGAFAAAGHNAVIVSGERAYNVFHAYPTSGSYARLRVAELVWDAEGWPISGGP